MPPFFRLQNNNNTIYYHSPSFPLLPLSPAPHHLCLLLCCGCVALRCITFRFGAVFGGVVVSCCVALWCVVCSFNPDPYTTNSALWLFWCLDFCCSVLSWLVSPRLSSLYPWCALFRRTVLYRIVLYYVSFCLDKAWHDTTRHVIYKTWHELSWRRNSSER